VPESWVSNIPISPFKENTINYLILYLCDYHNNLSQAIQNMNVLFGLSEGMGLEQLALMP